MKKSTYVIYVIGILVLSFCASLHAEDSGIEIFEAAQTLKAMDDSKIEYKLVPYEETDAPDPDAKPVTLHPWVQPISNKDGSTTISFLEPEGKALDAFNEGEKAFAAGAYKVALDEYFKVIEAMPDFLPIYNYIGDAYFMMKDYKNAKAYFAQGAKKNFINYQSHWFLADALYALGKWEEAAKEITIAHILNRNKKEILPTLYKYRKKTGKEWKSADFTPKYKVEKTGENTITIKTDDVWMLYAGAVALWEYEPGYMQRHGLDGNDKALLEYVKASDAFLGRVKTEPQDAMLVKISEGDDMLPFVWYEIILKEKPAVILAANKDLLDSIVKYLDNYHTVR